LSGFLRIGLSLFPNIMEANGQRTDWGGAKPIFDGDALEAKKDGFRFTLEVAI